MLRTLAILAVLGGLVGSDMLAPGAVQAGRSGKSRSARWGVGWDDGIGLRYEFRRTWGLGLRLSPNYGDIERTEDSWSDSSRDEVFPDRTYQSDRDTDTQAFSVELMLYRHFPLGRGFGWGPFAGVSYSRSLYDDSYRYVTVRDPGVDERIDINYASFETIRQTLSFLVGIRPTFRFHRRFLLETRFGLSISSSGRDTNDSGGGVEYSIYGDDEDLWAERSEDCSWNVSVFGEDLLSSAGVSFILFF